MTTQLRRIAYHEAGHAVVGQHFGLRVVAMLSQHVITRADGSTFKDWQGVAKANWNSLTPQQQRVAGVAGSVALCCWEACREAIAGAPEDWEPPLLDAVTDRMSDGDWTINNMQADNSTCDERPWIKAIATAHALLNSKTGPLWRELRREANNLIRKKFIYVPDWREETKISDGAPGESLH